MSSGLTDIYDLLYRLGATANYTGFFYTSYAVSLCLEQPERLLLVTKWLYPEVAKQYRTKWKSVERDIRTVGSIIWRENRPLLEQLARAPLTNKPRNAKLLAILTASLGGTLPVCGLGGAAMLPAGNSLESEKNGTENKGLHAAAVAKGSAAPREPQIEADNYASIAQVNTSI